MVAAITRLEQQVSFDCNIIQGQRQEFQHINETVGRLQRDMEGVVAFMRRMRDDLLGRFPERWTRVFTTRPTSKSWPIQ